MISHISTELSHQTFFSAFYFLFFFAKSLNEILWIFLLHIDSLSFCFFLPLLLRASSTTMDERKKCEKFVKIDFWLTLCFVLFIISFHPPESRLLVEFTMQFYHISYCSVVAYFSPKQTNKQKRERIFFFIQNNTWNTKRDNPKVDGEGYLSALRATVRQETKGKFSHARNGKVQKCSKKSFTLTPNCWLFRKKEDFK